ncbi:MAG: triose-phosphate isomerase [Desulfuromonadales bacterium]|nr:triose-phosphate isomerase [Desulfuromonadales bacterium]
MRIPVIAGNWKLYKTIGESVAMVNELKPLVAGIEGVEIVVAPVFTALGSVSAALSGSAICVSGQDCFWEEEGAFTGEVSPKLLKDAGCSHVIIGHSERRLYFGESDDSVNRKVRAAISAGLTAIVCVGETLEERDARATFTVVGKQIRGSLDGFSADDFKQIVIAYEPVWAIGTGKTATAEQAQDVHEYIRNLVLMLSGNSVSDSLRILYGGSVKPDNIKGLMAQPDIDGALIGGASLKAATFAEMIRICV